MHLIKSIVFTLAGINMASAACCPLEHRGVSVILNDLSAVSVAVTYNIGNVTAYTGGLVTSQLEGLLSAGNLVTTTLQQTTNDVVAAPKFSSRDSTEVLTSVQGVLQKILDVLTALNGKESLFAAAGLKGNILGSLQTHSSEEDALYTALAAKAQASDVTSFLAVQNTLAAAYKTIIGLYT